MITPEQLNPARQAVARGDFDVALLDLLGLWDGYRSTSIADAVVAVGARVEPNRPPLDVGDGAIQVAWIARAALDDPLDIEVLLASMTTDVSGRVASRRLGALANRADPRLVRALIAHLETNPWAGRRAGDAYLSRAIEVLAESQCAEAYAALRHHAALNAGPQKPIGRWLATVLVPVAQRQALVFEPKLSDAARGVCEDIVRLAEEPVSTPHAATVDALFKAIYAAPDDRGARAVLADVLSSAGDPRGEFIGLQLSRGPDDSLSGAERSLIAQHGAVWAGLKNRPGLRITDWRGGFPYAVRLAASPLGEADLPWWGLLGELDLSARVPDADVAWLAGPNEAPSLRVVRGAGTGFLSALIEWGARVPWHTLAFRTQMGGGAVPALLEALDAPSLRTLDLSAQESSVSVRWMAGLAAAAPIEHLIVWGRLRPWAVYSQFPGALQRVTVLSSKRGKGWRLEFTRGSDVVEVAFGGGNNRSPVSALQQLLRNESAEGFRVLRHRPSPSLHPERDWREFASRMGLLGLKLEGFE